MDVLADSPERYNARPDIHPLLQRMEKPLLLSEHEDVLATRTQTAYALAGLIAIHIPNNVGCRS
ncbi:hypothetical protein DX03_01050 [Stenotrophomonas rhizophila]|nr:hypothetical protein DX03_01050 [Stenotrophomonas rhizophila]